MNDKLGINYTLRPFTALANLISPHISYIPFYPDTHNIAAAKPTAAITSPSPVTAPTFFPAPLEPLPPPAEELALALGPDEAVVATGVAASASEEEEAEGIIIESVAAAAAVSVEVEASDIIVLAAPSVSVAVIVPVKAPPPPPPPHSASVPTQMQAPSSCVAAGSQVSCVPQQPEKQQPPVAPLL
ncbi:hypothetical protein CKM354_001130900 [Cercospora kikuchii]|uniref:Uncharacterized protein n=1 Tax=Cercospora kikuchii TaxID=84275 RepID=A0A9P3FI70_9PEZI|nr:uncharacterized protein CKM354_001130900 [Cercospora kikuchii]GIZ48241.1 hypothetical protein CKM354_001130900 [Cercospora kikuchii]